MKFGLAIIITPELDGQSRIIQSLSDDLREYLHDKQYGSSIKSYTIGVHCENIPLGFEKFSILPKPKYTKGRKEVKFEGIPFILEDNFACSIRLDFEMFKNAGKSDAEKILANEIINSLNIPDKMKSKIKDFDMSAFQRDIEQYFKSKKLI